MGRWQERLGLLLGSVQEPGLFAWVTKAEAISCRNARLLSRGRILMFHH